MECISMGIPRENISSNWYEDNNEIGMVLRVQDSGL